MIDFFFAMVAASLAPVGGGLGDTAAAETVLVAPAQTPTLLSPTVKMGANVSVGSGMVIGGAPLSEGTTKQVTPAPLGAASVQRGFDMSVVPAGLKPEPQTPTGKFTTAVEIRPILGATKGNWIAVREYDGKDLLYVSHLWGWRCGLHALAISVNDKPMDNLALPDCHMKYATPNAVLPEDGLPYLSFPLGSVQRVVIQIVYDDLTMDVATFERSTVLIP